MPVANQIDLNSDVGESFGRYQLGMDTEVIPLITSANIACGYHAGDPAVMRTTVELAAQNNVALGAHPGLPDLIGFGRRRLDASLEEIKDYTTYQVGALQGFAAAKGLKLQHVKPHGALYNMAVANPKIWEAVAEACASIDSSLILFALAGPGHKALNAIGKRVGIRIAYEFFADRAYNDDGSLVSRNQPDAIIKGHWEAAERVLKMVRDGSVVSINGRETTISAQTICVHGDNPSALALVKKIRETLKAAGVTVAPVGSFL